MDMEVKMPNIQTREEACQWTVMRVRALIAEETDCVTNMANTAAAIFEIWKDVSWAGFYRMKNGELVLGPFCGKPACRRIKVGSGVCGTAVSQKKTQLVPNVHEFPGHIACDSASNSEIVIPLHKGNEIVGVLDIDSPVLARFDEEDQEGLEHFVRILESIFDR